MDESDLWEAEPARIRRRGHSPVSIPNRSYHGDSDRHAERVNRIGGTVSRPDCIGGMVTSDPALAFRKRTHQSLLVQAGATRISMDSSPLTEQYRERRLAPSSMACRDRPVSLVCLVHLVCLVDLVCLVALVHLVAFVFRTRPTKQTRQTKQTRSLAVEAR